MMVSSLSFAPPGETTRYDGELIQRDDTALICYRRHPSLQITTSMYQILKLDDDAQLQFVTTATCSPAELYFVTARDPIRLMIRDVDISAGHVWIAIQAPAFIFPRLVYKNGKHSDLWQDIDNERPPVSFKRHVGQSFMLSPWTTTEDFQPSITGEDCLATIMISADKERPRFAHCYGELAPSLSYVFEERYKLQHNHAELQGHKRHYTLTQALKAPLPMPDGAPTQADLKALKNWFTTLHNARSAYKQVHNRLRTADQSQLLDQSAKALEEAESMLADWRSQLKLSRDARFREAAKHLVDADTLRLIERQVAGLD